MSFLRVSKKKKKITERTFLLERYCWKPIHSYIESTTIFTQKYLQSDKFDILLLIHLKGYTMLAAGRVDLSKSAKYGWSMAFFAEILCEGL